MTTIIKLSFNITITILLSLSFLVSCDDSSRSGVLIDNVDNNENSQEKIETDYPAQPESGTIFWGSSIHGNGDPVERHEKPSGETLSLRRTFWQWNERTTNMIDIAHDDLINGRLPWISVKPPPCRNNDSNCESWQWLAMADGAFDTEIDEMLDALSALPGPVWLTVHHEPEGGGGETQPNDLVGGIEAHVGMNRRVRERMNELEVDNVALAPILMAWTFQAASGRNPNDWWEEGIYDFVGIDIYRDSEGSLLTTGEAIGGGPVWPFIRNWAEERNTEVAVGEWGMRGSDDAAAQRMLNWYEAAVESHGDDQGARVVGLSAFDSGMNSSNSWELKGGQLEMFHQLLGDSRTASVNDFKN